VLCIILYLALYLRRRSDAWEDTEGFRLQDQYQDFTMGNLFSHTDNATLNVHMNMKKKLLVCNVYIVAWQPAGIF
jgi:hypothetical protein